jgi:hypothetical protein
LLRYGGLTGAAAIGATAAAPVAEAQAHRGGRVRPAPKPIPGGIELPGGDLIHVFAPGPSDITLPYTGVQLQGLDVEASVMTDFSGFTALAFHVGSATDGDGKRYLLETDMRAYRGTYVAQDGVSRHGSFPFVWVDLFEPSSGSQLHDYNGGVLPSGLFWVIQLRRDDLWVDADARRATLRVRDRAVLDSFQFGGTNSVPAMVSVHVTWQATGSAELRGEGTTVPTDDEAAFLGRLARARSTGSFEGSQLGFSFRSDSATTDRGYAQVGRERNGRFLASGVIPRSEWS